MKRPDRLGLVRLEPGLLVDCPKCGAPPLTLCRRWRTYTLHRARRARARAHGRT